VKRLKLLFTGFFLFSALLTYAGLRRPLPRAQAQTAAPRLFVSPPAFDVQIRPVRGGGPEVTAIEFRMELRGALNPKAQPLSLQAPITYAGRVGIADRVDSLVARDASGAVSLRVEDDPANPGGFPYYRHWRAERAVAPPVVVTYRMRSFTGVATPGPQFDFYSHGGGISGGGMALFVLPESIGVVSSRVKWDLTDLAPGSVAASTYGDGDLDLRGPVERLTQAYYMAGPLGRYTPPESTSGFHAYWLGQPAFDAPKEMAWTYQAYEYLRKFYRDTTTTSYRVFVRALPGTGGGTSLQNSFMLGSAPGAADPAKSGLRVTLAHEMGHMWVGGLSGGGVGGATWFNEGLNVYYTRLLLLRSGLASASDYERDVNQSARAYYCNPYRNTSAVELARLGFSKGVGAGSAQNVPYTRGSLYFADVDAKIRAASGGRRKLDDVILPLFERRRRGEDLSANTLLDALAKEIGPAAREQFEAVIARGETIVPESGAFGPCFERRPAKFEVEGKEVEGFGWARVSSIPDTRCREW
jgi:M61 glycyl aminopeptidase